MTLLALAAPERWSFQPAAPPLQVALAMVVLLALAVVAYWRSRAGSRWIRTLLLVMRCGVIGTLGVLLLGPSRTITLGSSPERPSLAILMDTSQSMQALDNTSRSRLDRAAEALTPELLSEWNRLAEVGLWQFSETVAPLETDSLEGEVGALACGESTLLGEAVAQTAAQSSLTGNSSGQHTLLVLSDGRDTSDNSIQNYAALAAARGTKVFVVGFGSENTRPDAALSAVALQDQLYPGEPGAIRVRIFHTALEGLSTILRVRQGAQTTDYPIGFGSARSQEQLIPVLHDEAGQFAYQLELLSLEDEANDRNNSQTVFIDVLDRRMRVLLVEGQPFWDSKFLAQALRKDEQLELVQLTQLGLQRRESVVTRTSGQAASLPESVAEWSEFDVVMIGRGIEHFLDPTSARQLVDYVSAGGHLVFYRGWPVGRPLSLVEAETTAETSEETEDTSAEEMNSDESASSANGEESDVSSDETTVSDATDPSEETGQDLAALDRGPRETSVNDPAEILQWQEALGPLLPGVLSTNPEIGGAVRLTPAGDAIPWMSALSTRYNATQAFERLGGLETLFTLTSPNPAAQVLATASVDMDGAIVPDQPFLTEHQYGAGRVVCLLGEGHWRWGLLTPDRRDLAGFYETLWSNMIRSLALGGDFLPGRGVSLQLGRKSIRFGEEQTIDVAYRHFPTVGAPPQLTVTTPDGQTRQLELTERPGPAPRYQGRYEPQQTGEHTIMLHAPGMEPLEQQDRFVAYNVNLEQLDTSADPVALQLLADLTGGRTLTPETLGELTSFLEQRTRVIELPPRLEPIWPTAWVMALFLTWTGLEWLLRRSAGMW